MPNQHTSWRDARRCEECENEFFPNARKQTVCSRCNHRVKNRIWTRKKNKTKPENFRGSYKK